MKRLFVTIVIAGTALGVAPAQADDPSATAQIRDHGQVYASFYEGNLGVDLYLNYERKITPGLAVDPGSVFPITIDPNDPPEAPASLVTESLTFSGFVFACEWSVGCWNRSIDVDSVPAGFFTFEDSPLPGNALTLSGSLSLEDGPYPLDLAIDLRADRPAVTRLWTDNTIVHPNVWADGSDVHVGSDTYAPLLTRHTYEVTGSASSVLGSAALAYGAVGFNRNVEAFTSIDATVPA